MSKNESSKAANKALSMSKHYFVTKAGHVIPLLSILAIVGIEPKPNTETPSESNSVNKDRDAWAAVPPNSLIVYVPVVHAHIVAFGPSGSGKILVTAEDVPVFLTKFGALG